MLDRPWKRLTVIAPALREWLGDAGAVVASYCVA